MKICINTPSKKNFLLLLILIKFISVASAADTFDTCSRLSMRRQILIKAEEYKDEFVIVHQVPFISSSDSWNKSAQRYVIVEPSQMGKFVLFRNNQVSLCHKGLFHSDEPISVLLVCSENEQGSEYVEQELIMRRQCSKRETFEFQITEELWNLAQNRGLPIHLGPLQSYCNAQLTTCSENTTLSNASDIFRAELEDSSLLVWPQELFSGRLALDCPIKATMQVEPQIFLTRPQNSHMLVQHSQGILSKKAIVSFSNWVFLDRSDSSLISNYSLHLLNSSSINLESSTVTSFEFECRNHLHFCTGSLEPNRVVHVHGLIRVQTRIGDNDKFLGMLVKENDDKSALKVMFSFTMERLLPKKQERRVRLRPDATSNEIHINKQFLRENMRIWSLFDENLHFKIDSLLNKSLSLTRDKKIVYLTDAENIEIGHNYTIDIFDEAQKDSKQLNIVINDDYSGPNLKKCQENRLFHCGAIRRRQECVETCGGYNVLHPMCTWVVDEELGYSTCSSDPYTCPDLVCDSLEKSSRSCPQDCVDHERVNVFLPHLEADSGSSDCGIGIISGHNKNEHQDVICFCTHNKDDNICSCLHNKTVVDVRRNFNEDKKETNYDFITSSALLFVIVILLVAVSVPFLIVWRRIRIRRANESSAARSHPVQLVRVRSEDEANTSVSASTSLLTTIDNTDLTTTLTALWRVRRKLEIPRERLELGEVIGEGHFGHVIRATMATDNGPVKVAIKVLKSRECSRDLDEFASELSLLQELSHPNVIALLGFCVLANDQPGIVMEHADIGSMLNFLRKCKRASRQADAVLQPRVNMMTEDCVAMAALHVAKGMQYLASLKLIHRDLAARNVLLTSTFVCKVSDFGLARDVYVECAYLKRTEGKLPLKWMAPECLQQGLYTTKSDVWSFAVFIWEMLTLGSNPYPGIGPEQLLHLLLAGYRMAAPNNAPSYLSQLLEWCWQGSPKDRPCFDEIVNLLQSHVARDTDYLHLQSGPNDVDNPVYLVPRSSKEGEGEEDSEDSRDELELDLEPKEENAA